jgi:hypothetical protein
MPKLRRNSRGNLYIITKNSFGQIITLQVAPQAEPWLRQVGIRVGEELGSAYRVLRENDWLSTRGEISGGGDGSQGTRDAKEEPLTIPWSRSTEYAPRFLLDSRNSIHYTRLYVENSSDYWLTVPMIIKHHGAKELIRLGAVIGQEFTGRALNMMLERRWVYSDDMELE